MKRRSFLRVVGGTAGGCALGVAGAPVRLIAAETAEDKGAGMPRRELGRTGQKVSVVGFPGLAMVHCDQERGAKGLHQAFERGINYFDVAPAYGNGEAEIRMGIGLQGLERSRIFLACKTKKRDKDGAQAELENSLKVLKTDYFDLYQLHHLVRASEVQRALGPGGAMETILKAKEAGKIKYIGFSAHTTKAALAAMRGFKFDTVMFPINFVEYYTRGFGKEVLELAQAQGAAVLAIKPLSFGAWPQGPEGARKWWYRCTETQEEVSLALRWTLSQKAVVAGVPPSYVDLLDRSIEAVKAYSPVTEVEQEKLKGMAANCGSLFKAEEEQAANAKLWPGAIYPPSPYECCLKGYV